jgi:transposase
VDERALRPVVQDRERFALKPKALLTLLSHCYANQIYGSTDIARSLERCVEYRAFFHDVTADARLIRQFRKDNREALQNCLAAALRFAAEEKVRSGAVTRISGAQLVEEAKRRIIMAMFIDGMALDGE